MKLDIEVLELFIIKLMIVVGDDGPREAELTEDGLSYKFSNLGLGDLGHQFGLHPFGEVIDSYEQELLLCWGWEEGSKYVDPIGAKQHPSRTDLDEPRQDSKGA